MASSRNKTLRHPRGCLWFWSVDRVWQTNPNPQTYMYSVHVSEDTSAPRKPSAAAWILCCWYGHEILKSKCTDSCAPADSSMVCSRATFGGPKLCAKMLAVSHRKIPDNLCNGPNRTPSQPRRVSLNCADCVGNIDTVPVSSRLAALLTNRSEDVGPKARIGFCLEC